MEKYRVSQITEINWWEKNVVVSKMGTLVRNVLKENIYAPILQVSFGKLQTPYNLMAKRTNIIGFKFWLYYLFLNFSHNHPKPQNSHNFLKDNTNKDKISR